MNKVKFWKTNDDDFSFDESSSSFDTSVPGVDSFNNPSGPSPSGLPPGPSSNSLDDSFDPLAPTPGGAFDDSMSTSDPFSSGSDSSTSIPPFGGSSSQGSPSSDPFGSSQSQDPFARPTPPPNNNSDSVGQNLAHQYMQNDKSGSIPLNPSNPLSPSNPLKPGSEGEMINLKLDAIRSEVSAMSQRLLRLEHLIEEQNKKRGW